MNDRRLLPKPSTKKILDPTVRFLYEERVRQGLTQKALGKRAGFGSNLASKWETGRHGPTWFLMQCWAEVLGYRFVLTKIGEEKQECHNSIPQRSIPSQDQATGT